MVPHIFLPERNAAHGMMATGPLKQNHATEEDHQRPGHLRSPVGQDTRGPAEGSAERHVVRGAVREDAKKNGACLCALAESHRKAARLPAPEAEELREALAAAERRVQSAAAMRERAKNTEAP